MQEYVEFRQVTGDGLDYAMAALGIEDDALRQRLMDIYMRLDAYPEVKDVLSALKAGGIKTAVLSTGSPEMLSPAVDNAGIADLLDDVFSVDSIGVYKPHPSVYQMAVDGLGVDAGLVGIFDHPLDKGGHTRVDHALELDVDVVDGLGLGAAREHEHERHII